MIFCIKLPNFIHIGPPNAEIWRYIKFSRWRPRRLPVSYLLMTLSSISKPNFVNIHQFVAEINYFRFEKTNVRHIGILLPISTSVISPQLACYFASGWWILSKRDHLLRKYDVVSIFQDGGHGRSILVPVSYLLMSLPLEGQNLSSNQILWTYLDSRLRYNYFRFLNIGILLPVSTMTTSP